MLLPRLFLAELVPPGCTALVGCVGPPPGGERRPPPMEGGGAALMRWPPANASFPAERGNARLGAPGVLRAWARLGCCAPGVRNGEVIVLLVLSTCASLFRIA